MKKIAGGAVFAITALFLLPIYAGHLSDEIGEIESDTKGAIRIYNTQGKLMKVIVPVKNERAKEAVRENRGKADSVCPQPVAMVVTDIAAASEQVEDNTGFVGFRTYNPFGSGITLGILFLDDGFYQDRNTDSNNRQLSIFLANPGVDGTNLDLKAGESLSITLPDGQVKMLKISANISIEPHKAVVLYADNKGNLYWNPELTQPMNPNSGGC